MRKNRSLASRLLDIPPATPGVYCCTSCGASDEWKNGWLWFGDYVRGATKILCPKCAAPHRHEVID